MLLLLFLQQLRHKRNETADEERVEPSAALRPVLDEVSEPSLVRAETLSQGVPLLPDLESVAAALALKQKLDVSLADVEGALAERPHNDVPVGNVGHRSQRCQESLIRLFDAHDGRDGKESGDIALNSSRQNVPPPPPTDFSLLQSGDSSAKSRRDIPSRPLGLPAATNGCHRRCASVSEEPDKRAEVRAKSDSRC